MTSESNGVQRNVSFQEGMRWWCNANTRCCLLAMTLATAVNSGYCATWGRSSGFSEPGIQIILSVECSAYCRTRKSESME